jgi:poly(beta-D-mannuronate) lyase
MSAQIDAPNTDLKRGLYYFVIAVFGGVTVSGCQTTMPNPNGMAETEFTEFLKVSAPTTIDKPLVTTLPLPGKVSVDAVSRRAEIDGKNICAATDIDLTVTVLADVSAPEDYGLDERFNTVADQFKRLSERCLAGSQVSCRTIQISSVKWARESKLEKPRSTDGGKWNDTLTINMRLLSPMLAALGVAEEFSPMPEGERRVLIPWVTKIADNFEHGMRNEGSYEGGRAGTTARRAAHNHAVQSSNAQMSLGAFIGDSERFNVGINQWFITLESMRGDGSLPIETRRGARALFYHGRTITALSALAEKAKVQGIDLWDTAPTETKTIHLAVKFFIDAIENPDLVLSYASTNKSPGPSKDFKRQDIGTGSTFGWIAPYMARFPDHPNTTRMLNRVTDLDAVTHNYLTLSLDRQIQMNGTGLGDWNFVNGRCFYSAIQ